MRLVLLNEAHAFRIFGPNEDQQAGIYAFRIFGPTNTTYLHFLLLDKCLQCILRRSELLGFSMLLFVEAACFSSCIWNFQGLNVTVQHAVQILNEGGTSHNVCFLLKLSQILNLFDSICSAYIDSCQLLCHIIESFSDILMRVKQNLPMDNRAQIFQCNCWVRINQLLILFCCHPY